MTKRMSAEELLAVWRRIAPDADRSFAIPAANEFYKREVDNPVSLKRLVDSLQLRLSELHSEFARAFDYTWTVEAHPSLYHPAAEAQYQLHVLDCAATLWDACPPERRASDSFGRLMARYSRLWGGVSSTTPKARHEGGVRFVIVPFGWDEHLHIALDGLRAFSPSLMPRDTVVAPTIQNPEIRPADAVPSWNALLARALASVLGCHELLTPLFVKELISAEPSLQCASSMNRPTEVLDAQLSRCSLAMLFSIAHEVGHHLADALPSIEGVNAEVHADRLAMNALWNCPGSARCLKGTDESDDALTLISGGLFFAAVEIGTSVERSVSRYLGQPARRSTMLAERISDWAMVVEQLATGQPELVLSADAARAVLAVSQTYCEAMGRYAESVLSQVEPVARELVSELHRSNPDLHDLPSLEQRLRGA